MSEAALAEMRRQGAQIAGAEQARVELFEVAALLEKGEGALGAESQMSAGQARGA